MWGEIVLALGPTILEAIGGKLCESREKTKVLKKLESIIKDKFADYKDTSLDCVSFYDVINSEAFIEIIRNYYFLIIDERATDEYVCQIFDFISEKCQGVVLDDVRGFLLDIEELYTEYLRKIIEESPQIFAAFQLITLSHREIIAKIRDNKNELLRYLETLKNRKITISNESIQLYHSVCNKEYGVIRFTGISGAERRKEQNINEFYVQNLFSYYGKEIDKLYKYGIDEIESISLQNFFDFGNKIVLIGGAGLGKSTTLNYLFCNYEKLYDATALKLKVDLKEYAKEIGEKKRNLLWCISQEFAKRIKHTTYTSDEIQDIVADYLSRGKCLVILDALDEIPTQNIRNKVRDEIATFSTIYYLNRFIISTREAGYLRNRFDDSFLHIRINKFNSEQIEKYSKNWYVSYYENKENVDEFWEKFNNETKRARCENLISNPIILILALVIFDIEKNLPNRRIEFYQKCIETFLTERENRKAAMVLEEKTKSILAMNLTVPKVAYYKFERLSDNIGYKFNYDELNKAVMNAIAVSDEINWSTAVKQYSEYLVERTELIQEVDEETLDFAHKTFYEYFLAFYFSRISENDELINLLKEWIGDSNYDELARLIVEIVIQNNEPKQHDFIINSLFEMLLEKKIKNDEGPSKLDIFALISDLYNHNMLQPKFHKQYNDFILCHPIYVERVAQNFGLRMRQRNQQVKYDANNLSDLFKEKVNAGNLCEVIDSLFFLNNDFKRNVVMTDKTGVLYHITNLFSYVKESDKANKIDKELYDAYSNEFKYFLNDGIEYTLKYPQIFISVISMSLYSDEYLKNLFAYDFVPCNVFYIYTNPSVLYELIKKANSSKTYFLLLLILFVDCIDKATNSIFDYVFHRSTHHKDKQNNKDEVMFCIKLWNVLNLSKSYEDFKQSLIEMDTYDQNYDKIYEKLFFNYTKNSKGVDDVYIKDFIEHYNK